MDVQHLSAQPVPDAWKGALKGQKVEVLPLVSQNQPGRMPGWCTYTYEHEQAPELEVFCGGVNSKTPKAGAVWRQGNLLHFGFDLSPAEMNDTGRALLLNAIAYISRFTEDRPLVHTPCVFVQGKRLFDRGVVGRLLDRGGDLNDLQYYLSKETYAGLKGKDREAVAQWYKHARDYLHADKGGGLLTVDAEARSFGVGPASTDILEKAVDLLKDKGQAAHARKFFLRYVTRRAPARQLGG
jgi:hypothetical protein